DRPVACGTPCNPKARSKIRLIRLDEIGPQPPVAGGTNAALSDRRKDNIATIKITASVFDNAGPGLHRLWIETLGVALEVVIVVGKPNIDQRHSVTPGGHIFVAHSVADGD